MGMKVEKMVLKAIYFGKEVKPHVGIPKTNEKDIITVNSSR